MPMFVKLNNHVVNHQTPNVNHSVPELPFNMFASFKTVKLMVLMLNKVLFKEKKIFDDIIF
jgi:hypothetical protein